MSFKVEHRMGVPAPAKVIWEVLVDLERWAEWNPTHPRIVGQLRIGETLEVHEAFPGAPSRVIRPKVVDWVPDAQILWTLSQAGGLIRRIRYIEIEPFDEQADACILSNGEVWQGIVGQRVGKAARWRLRAGFEAFNQAVVEQVARRMGAKATGEGR
jgi:hypothetical protein